jgi:hypothetical protein
MMSSNGFIIFCFNTKDEMHVVLEKGPWMLGGCLEGRISFFNNGTHDFSLIKTKFPPSQFGSDSMVCLSPCGPSRD